MTTVEAMAERFRAALADDTDPGAVTVMSRVCDTLDHAIRPLSGIEIRRRTCGGDTEIQAALRVMTESDLVVALPRRQMGGGTSYTLPGRRAA